MAEPAHRRLTYAAYLALERETDVRHEFLDGEAWAMAGGSIRHSGIKSNVALAFGIALRGGPCRFYDSDLKVRVPETGLATYPDLAVICGGPERHPEDRNAATNPALLVEVLSKATESWDRGGKFAHYRKLPSLKHYVLVSQDSEVVEHYARQDDGSWRLTEHTDLLPVLGVEIPIEGFFRDLPDEE